MDSDPAEREALRQFWEQLERSRERVEAAVDERMAQIPAFAALRESVPPPAREARRARSLTRRRDVMLDGEWDEWVTDLRAQGVAYARMGIGFHDWYALLSACREAVWRDLIPPGEGHVLRTLQGMERMLGTAMSEIASSYLAEKVRAIREGEVERERLTARLDRQVRELERSNRELDDFAYVTSHDLKSPLRDVRNLATWIAEDAAGKLPPESARHLELLGDRVQRMERLLDDLLEYSRVGRLLAPPETFAVREVFDEVAALHGEDTGFGLAYEGDDVRLSTPRAPLAKVLRNLVGNAIKHHDRAPGAVTVRVAEEGERVRVTVSDDGPGVPPEFHERVFRMFQTLRPRDAVEGSGAGLAIVKKTVELFGGEVSLRSEGRGVEVSFTWPRSWVRPEGAEER